MDELLFELKKYYGQDAEFREGQAEAILGVLQRKRTLVVQKTGWGKSLVYFLATKILRKKSNFITLIISPLLALMNNQVSSADKLKLTVKTINSENPDEWKKIQESINDGKVDALIISPERLANEDFKKILLGGLAARIGLFVVDEAHCISDWGHDFRPDYRRIVEIVNKLPSNIPVLATTATANDRVINDIKKQLGDNLIVSRGSLMRESLAIQVIRLNSKEERLAWITDNINFMDGTGIVYCLTVKDCKLVDKWLKQKGILSECYYGDLEEEKKEEIIPKFMNNQMKVLVATVAFGMGFDKPDIGFVIHFQRPGNIVAYYQQIGRAGRAIPKALAILLCGEEDNAINNYFIDTAFPTEDVMDDVIQIVEKYPGIGLYDFEKYLNVKRGKIEKCIKYLEVNGDIYKDKGYYKSLRPWKPDMEKSRVVTEIRKKELRQMNDFTYTSNCYMQYIADVLNDTNAKKCCHCSNCLGHDLFPWKYSKENVIEVQKFIRTGFNVIRSRKQWAPGFKVEGKTKIKEDCLCEIGRVLSNYGDAGWGKIVSEGKYKNNYFDDTLVQASYELLEEYIKENEIHWVTNVSSNRRPELVRDFAKRLAGRLGLEYYDVIRKIENGKCQKELNTNYFQCKNAYNSFEVVHVFPQNVLLVDDMVDSGWTFTVCGYRLRQKGCGKVFPFALANSAGR